MLEIVRFLGASAASDQNTDHREAVVDKMDATGPIVTELRSLLAELLSGMRKADAVAGLLPAASKPINFDVLAVDNVKRNS